MYDNENMDELREGQNSRENANDSGAYFDYLSGQQSQHTQNPSQGWNLETHAGSTAQTEQTARVDSEEGRAEMKREAEVKLKAESKREAEPGKKAKSGKMGFFSKVLVSISLGLFFGIFAGIGFVGVQQASDALKLNGEAVKELPAEKEQEPETAEVISPQVQPAGTTVVYKDSDTHVSDIVQDVMPAMVSIINNYTEVTSFWGQTYREELSSSGSGIIVSQNEEELLVVTNQHVVDGAEQLMVTLIDETQVEAYVKGVDADMDLAVIAIRLEDLSYETREAISIATLGDSDRLILGEQVIAIGNALGYGQSVTVGYVSALDRKIELEDGSQRSFIQTDAAINPGNSGGALLNAQGEVIGINSNKIGGTSIEGMGYAIPITAASPIIADLMERQTRNRVSEADMGYLGISLRDVTEQISEMYGMPTGVYVVSVVEGSGADAAGMVMGDVIVSFDGNRITEYADLQEVLQYYAVGDTAKVKVMRPMNGVYTEIEMEVTLGERPE